MDQSYFMEKLGFGLVYLGNSDEFGFDRQMNWSNSIESGQDSSPMSPESESSSTASTSSIDGKVKKKSKKVCKNRRHRQFSSDSEDEIPPPKWTQNHPSYQCELSTYSDIKMDKMEEFHLLGKLGFGSVNMGELEELDISPQDFEPYDSDFKSGFACQMNWNNSKVSSGQDSSPMSPQLESSSTASTSLIDCKVKEKSKKANKNRRRHRQFSSDSEGDFPAPKRTQNRKSPNIVHWLLQLLMNPETSDVLAWEDYNRGVFKIVSQERLGELWGAKKQNPDMTYNNVARTMRYHYQSKGQELQIVSRKLVYKFSSQFLNANRI